MKESGAQSLHLSVYRDLSASLDPFGSWLELSFFLSQAKLEAWKHFSLLHSAHVFQQNNPLNEFMFPDPAVPVLTAENFLGRGPRYGAC